MTRNRYEKEFGDQSEQTASEYLLSLGWTLVTRQYRVKGGEIDLIAFDGETLVFIEVKARSHSTPEEALNPKKAEALRLAARAYLRENSLEEVAHRFDLVAIENGDLRHVQGCF